MKKAIFIILVFFCNIGCEHDSVNQPSENIQGINTNENNNPSHYILAIGDSCISGKMNCIDNKSCVCIESKWIIIQDCSLNKLNCYFNNLDHTIYNIPYYAECN